MLLPKPDDAIHKAWLYRILTAIADDAVLAKTLHFKGGTCAAMRGLLDRFSVDLDFEIIDPEQIPTTRKLLEKVFSKLGLDIKDQSRAVPQYFLKYENVPGKRNTIQFDVNCPAPKSNIFEPVRFTDIDRILSCHTIPTMVANKMVAITDRFNQHGSIAGRDLYDIHLFLLKGYDFDPEIILERTNHSAPEYLKKLHHFVETKISQTILDQDLNTLLPVEQFHRIRKILKPETLMMLRDRIPHVELKKEL